MRSYSLNLCNSVLGKITFGLVQINTVLQTTIYKANREVDILKRKDR